VPLLPLKMSMEGNMKTNQPSAWGDGQVMRGGDRGLDDLKRLMETGASVMVDQRCCSGMGAVVVEHHAGKRAPRGSEVPVTP
jgi:hypothetical protein